MSDFPPQDINAFLRLCAGEWLTVRSRFHLGGQVPAGSEPGSQAMAPEPGPPGPFVETETAAEDAQEHWHDSARGALVVTYSEAGNPEDPGALLVTPPAIDGPMLPSQKLVFATDGSFERQAQPTGSVSQGRWQLWSDGSLELTLRHGTTCVRERIWFTKANLRLRSSVERDDSGQLHSEIGRAHV